MSVQARPKDYATAIYDLAVEKWIHQLGAAHAALSGDAGLSKATSDPGTSVTDRLSLLGEAVPGGLDKDVRKLLGTLIEVGQIDQLDAIVAEFRSLVQRQPESQTAKVTSAVPLTEDEKGALEARLTKRFGADLEFQFEVDPQIIGGIYLRVGDQVIDGTVAGKMAALRDRLTA